MPDLPAGLYESLLYQELRDLLERQPELRSVFGKIEADEEPARYAAFLTKVVERALRVETDSTVRLQICNHILDYLAGDPKREFLSGNRLVPSKKPILLEITPTRYLTQGIPRPETSLSGSSLFTGSPSDPQLVHELLHEMVSADSTDVLISFIKWSGLQLLMAGFEEMSARGTPIRIITTSYMGASDPEAIEWLARLPNVSIRISYDTNRTRLHAKAYHFHRASGYSTAYIGSANMSHAAMTSGLEWNLKVTAQDLPHIMEKFVAEFETYWNSREFVAFDAAEPQMLRDAIRHARNSSQIASVFFDIRPHAFQERILEALEAERLVHGQWRNLIVAATGTGKTVVAAFDFRRFYESRGRTARLLFVAHRREILEQAVGTFRGVLKIPDFGELLVGPHAATRLDQLFCSVDMLRNRQLWKQVGKEFYDFVIVDEVHHGPAASYREIFEEFTPSILLGLTATPERMDGRSVAADFGNRFAAEIRLPEALDEKLLCPFHYFAVADPIATSDERFWRNGKYDVQALENVYTGADVLAKQRVETVITALTRFEPNLSNVRGIGFCAGVAHARFMAEQFSRRGIPAAALLGETDDHARTLLLDELRAGRLTFLFTRDVLNEGLDIPHINTLLFLRPTESMTVFLQQLGRGLRHAPEKDCVTVVDLVGQVHRRYRLDLKFKALLPKVRFNIESEVELDFPHLPSGCSVQIDKVAREYVLANIRENLKNLAQQVPERLQTFEQESGQMLTFSNFVHYHDYDPSVLLSKDSWTGWRARARLTAEPTDPDRDELRRALVRVAQTNGPREVTRLRAVASELRAQNTQAAIAAAEPFSLSTHYRFWGKAGTDIGFATLREAFQKLSQNPSFLDDVVEVLDWTDSESRIGGISLSLPFACPLELHAQYGNNDIKAALGLATFSTAGQTGVGLLHAPDLRAYAALVTFQKTEREFSPTTMYADYPVSREFLHWESPSNTTQKNETGQNLIHHDQRAYTVLIFARNTKKIDGRASPFTFLGPADLIEFQKERPIQMMWRLAHSMPAAMFEENRRGG
jgi:superfamily II DNA or RNA helicase/HKD family nuclease